MKKRKIILGIDPGKTGAMAIIYPCGDAEVGDYMNDFAFRCVDELLKKHKPIEIKAYLYVSPHRHQPYGSFLVGTKCTLDNGERNSLKQGY